MAKSYRDLVVWQMSMDVAENIYQLTRSFPKEEMFGLVSQMRRAAVSIPSNIAEGEGRKSRNEFHHFLGIALGSKSELETQMELCERIGYLQPSETEGLKDSLARVGRMLSMLRTKLQSPTTNH